MDSLFSIGRTAKLNQISVKTLRFYDEIGLLHPAYVDPETGYRYYSHEQFYLIDAIRFAKRLGLSLDEIRENFSDMDPNKMLSLYRVQKTKTQAALQEHFRMLRTIEEEIRRLESVVSPRQQYRQIKPQRTLLCMERPEGASFTELDIALKRYILSPKFDSYRTYRFGEIFDGTALQKGKVRLIGIYTDLAAPPDFPDSHILVRPAGEYLCFQCKFFAEHPELSAFRSYLSQTPISKVFADELNYCTDYSEIISEVQISV